MDRVYAIIRRALIGAICVAAIAGLWQSNPDVFARLCATLLLALVIAMSLFTKLEAAVVERPATPPPVRELHVNSDEKCQHCGATMGDIGRGIECESLFHHEIAVAFLGRKQAK